MEGDCIAWGKHVWKSFNSTRVFVDASFCFKRGMNVIWAPNGSGKTTLIKMLLGILRPDRGIIWIDRRFKLGVVLEDHVALRNTPLPQLVVYGAMIKGTISDFKVLDYLNLRGEIGKNVGELSSGNSKKALVAQALVGDPELLVLDEPLANLDPASRIMLSATLNKLRDNGVNMIIATHILSLLQPDNIYTISDGKILGPYKLGRSRRIHAINPETGVEEELTIEEAVKAYYQGWIILDS